MKKEWKNMWRNKHEQKQTEKENLIKIKEKKMKINRKWTKTQIQNEKINKTWKEKKKRK